jgi:hypothetical protein
MIRRNARLRKEYLYRKSLEGKEKAAYERKRKIRQARGGCWGSGAVLFGLDRGGGDGVVVKGGVRLGKCCSGGVGSGAAAAGGGGCAVRAPLVPHAAAAPLTPARSCPPPPPPPPPARQALEEGKPIPNELRGDEGRLRNEVGLEDDNTALPRDHVDDEYARAGARDPKVSAGQEAGGGGREVWRGQGAAVLG